MALIPSLQKNEIDESVKYIYTKFEESSGSVPEWVKVMAHCPQILEDFTHLFNSIMKEGKVDVELKWKIGYTVSHMLKCPFCIDVTEKMLRKFGAENIETIKNKKNLPNKEKEVLKLVEDITDNAYIDDSGILDKFLSKFDYEQAAEIISVIGLFNYINRFNNTFAILPE